MDRILLTNTKERYFSKKSTDLLDSLEIIGTNPMFTDKSQDFIESHPNEKLYEVLKTQNIEEHENIILTFFPKFKTFKET